MGVPTNRAMSIRSRVLFSIAAGSVVGAAVALFSPGPFLWAWLVASVLAIPAVYGLLAGWHWAGGGRALGWIIALAFLLRLVLGVGLSLTLPVYGYIDNECQQAGYLFKDACERDREAYSIAQGSEGLFWGSGITLDNDQYGGLAFLSAWIYRYLSPDAHRSFLILILGAFVAALGVPFLHRAVRLRWPARVAAIATLIYAFYPDGLFFTSSQMREPFLLGFTAIAFWAVLSLNQHLRISIIVLLASVLGMAFFSTRVTLIIAGILAIWFWLEYSAGREGHRWQAVFWLGLVVGFLGMLVLTWGWFRSSTQYDVQLTLLNSGQIATRISEIGEQWLLPFTLVYGLFQPVLPAAIAESSIPLWKTIVIFRSAGWYALAPFLVYGLFTLWRQDDPRMRRLALWLIVSVFFWLMVASLRGGGDLTDNPRYRSLFLPWLALLAAWSVDWALARKDAWLWRWVAVEGIFLAFFTHWYISRYYRLWYKMDFWTMVIWIIGLSALVLVGGWVWDRYNGKWRKQPRMM